MKIHNRIYKTLTTEPFESQTIDDRKIEFYSMNDTPYMAQFVQKGRFYVWTSNGQDYKLLIERGFYDKVSYFFTEEINKIWIDFLENVGETNKKMTRIYTYGSALFSLIAIIVLTLLNQSMIGVIVALFVTFAANTVQTTKLNKVIKEKNYHAQVAIKDLLTEDGFNQLLDDQDEYAKEFFKFDDEFEDEEFEENFEIEENLELEENIEDAEFEADEVLEAEIIEAETINQE